jgi:hypothetical protein
MIKISVIMCSTKFQANPVSMSKITKLCVATIITVTKDSSWKG